MKTIRLIVLVSLWLCAGLLLAACGGAPEAASPTQAESDAQPEAPTATEPLPEPTPTDAPAEVPLPFELDTPAFAQGEIIPARFACTGEDLSPELSWGDPPEGTVSLALLFDDPDGFDWVHWLVYNLPPELRGLDEGQPDGETVPAGGLQGRTDFGQLAYGGPCPPPGAPHTYLFTLYALDTELALEPGATVDEFKAAIEGHILAEAEYTGEFSR